MEFKWIGGEMSARLDWGEYTPTIVRFSTPAEFKMSTEDARDMSYAILDSLKEAPAVKTPVDRCACCKDMGKQFTVFPMADGARGIVCDECAHAIYTVRFRKAWKQRDQT